MAIDPRLVTVAPHESQRVVANGLDVLELEVPSVDERNRPLVALTVRAWTVTAKQLVRIDASMSVLPVDLHHARAAGRAKLDRRWRVVIHEVRPSQRPDAAPVRSRTATVACCASSWSSASWICWRSTSGHGVSA